MRYFEDHELLVMFGVTSVGLWHLGNYISWPFAESTKFAILGIVFFGGALFLQRKTEKQFKQRGTQSQEKGN